MDHRTRTALEGSIAKWQAIADGRGTDRGGDNCPLCELFADEFDPAAGYEDDNAGCHGCPVKARTGKQGCIGSPYYSYRRVMNYAGMCAYFDFATTPAQLAAARAELAFLQSLLPPSTQPTTTSTSTNPEEPTS